MSKNTKHRHTKEEFESAINQLSVIDLDANPELLDSREHIVEFEVYNKPVPSLVDLCFKGWLENSWFRLWDKDI